ncbi:hypothetical protein DMUE_3886 [Dictyocoela muelleri]|nr:hypothetical protein DMUE_3886 [Dictyocoela muelleri]
MSRKQKVEITKHLVKSIETKIKENISLKNIAISLSVSYSTVKRISKCISENENFVENFQPKIKRRKRSSIIHEIAPIILTIIDNKNDINIAEIKEKFNLMNIETSKSSICRGIKKINYSRKRLSIFQLNETHRNLSK